MRKKKMMIGVVAAASALAGAQEIELNLPVRQAPGAIDLRPIQGGVEFANGSYEILDGVTAVSQRERARHGAGEDAPRFISVRVFDGVFLIDPFVPMNQLIGRPIDEHGESIATQRQVFGKFSLNTSRELFGWERVERTAELFEILEVARQDWLRRNGFMGVRTFTNPNAGSDGETTSAEPQPRMRIEKPSDLPRTRSRESVRGNEPTPASRLSARVLEGEGVRVSRPSDVLREDAVVSRPGDDRGESVASR